MGVHEKTKSFEEGCQDSLNRLIEEFGEYNREDVVRIFNQERVNWLAKNPKIMENVPQFIEKDTRESLRLVLAKK